MFDTCSFKPTNDGFPPSSGGGGGAVTSVFGRTGAVIAVAGDYNSTQITNSSGVTGAFVTDALNTLKSGKLSTTLTSANIIVGNGSNVATAVAMSGDATISNTGAVTLANTTVVAATYGSATQVPVFAVDSKGRITGVTNTTISAASPYTYSAITLSANTSYNKAALSGANYLFITTNDATTRTITIDSTGFVANDFLVLSFNENSPGLITLIIGGTTYSSNTSNTINAVYTGSAWSLDSSSGSVLTSGTNTKMAIGFGAAATGDNSIAIGHGTGAFGFGSTIIGRGIVGSTNGSITAIGYNITASGVNSVVIGRSAVSSGNNTVVIGSLSTASTNTGVVAIGQGITTTNTDNVIIGRAASGSGSNSVSIGQAATSSGNLNISIGNQAAGTGASTIRIGFQAVTSTGTNIVAIGDQIAVTGSSSVGIGAAQNITNTGVVAIGQGITTTNTDAVIIGRLASGGGSGAVVVGQGATGSANNAIAIGQTASVTNGLGIAIGNAANTNQSYGLCLGYAATANSEVRQIAMGALSYPRHYGALSRRIDTQTGLLDATTPARHSDDSSWNKTTTDATPTIMTLFDVANKRLTLQDNEALHFDIYITAKRTGSTNTLIRRIAGGAVRGSGVGTTSIVGQTQIYTHGTALTTTVSADTTNGAVQLEVTGVAAQTWEWTAYVKYQRTRTA